MTQETVPDETMRTIYPRTHTTAFVDTVWSTTEMYAGTLVRRPVPRAGSQRGSKGERWRMAVGMPISWRRFREPCWVEVEKAFDQSGFLSWMPRSSSNEMVMVG